MTTKLPLSYHHATPIPTSKLCQLWQIWILTTLPNTQNLLKLCQCHLRCKPPPRLPYKVGLAPLQLRSNGFDFDRPFQNIDLRKDFGMIQIQINLPPYLNHHGLILNHMDSYVAFKRSKNIWSSHQRGLPRRPPVDPTPWDTACGRLRRPPGHRWWTTALVPQSQLKNVRRSCNSVINSVINSVMAYNYSWSLKMIFIWSTTSCNYRSAIWTTPFATKLVSMMLQRCLDQQAAWQVGKGHLSRSPAWKTSDSQLCKTFDQNVELCQSVSEDFWKDHG